MTRQFADNLVTLIKLGTVAVAVYAAHAMGIFHYMPDIVRTIESALGI